MVVLFLPFLCTEQYVSTMKFKLLNANSVDNFLFFNFESNMALMCIYKQNIQIAFKSLAERTHFQTVQRCTFYASCKSVQEQRVSPTGLHKLSSDATGLQAFVHQPFFFDLHHYLHSCRNCTHSARQTTLRLFAIQAVTLLCSCTNVVQHCCSGNKTFALSTPAYSISDYSPTKEH